MKYTRSEWVITERWYQGRACEWRHPSGAVVRHCRHPTALRPYFIPGKLLELGTFRLLANAQETALWDLGIEPSEQEGT